jgi:5-methylcytosine-specific restriction endonuclease McrA
MGRSKKKRRSTQKARRASPNFLLTYEWRRLRMVVLKKRGARCECCGATPADGIRVNVDHIQPRRLRPDLALTESNLQVLCEDCNHGKGNWDRTDWRGEKSQTYEDAAPVFMATWQRPKPS